jgi:hypothetical protein
MGEKVTKDQYEFFRSLYEDEQETSEKLEGRAKVYLGIVSAFLAAIIVKADEARKIADTLHLRWAFLLADAIPRHRRTLPCPLVASGSSFSRQ